MIALLATVDHLKWCPLGPPRWTLEERMNRYGVVMQEGEAVDFLVLSAREFRGLDCRKPECAVCADFVERWHEIYLALSTPGQKEVDVNMGYFGVVEPVWPGEEE